MAGAKSVIRLKPGAPPLEISNIQKATNSKTGLFSERRIITYTLGKRLFTLVITKLGCEGRVNIVYLELTELNGKASSANLNLRLMKNDKYGVLCTTSSKLIGSYDSFKENYSVPPLPETELTCYVCRETGSGGCFTVEKRKVNSEVVESVKATHAFVIDDELSFNVKIKIRSVREGLSVEVGEPVKVTMDYTKQAVARIRGKMESEMDGSTLSQFRNSIPKLQSYGDSADKRYDSE